MRNLLIPLLVASALVPAAASAQDGGPRAPRSEGERGNSSGDRPQQIERAQRVERSSGENRTVRIERPERPVRTNIERTQTAETARPVRRIGRDQTVQQAQQEQQIRDAESKQATQPDRRVRRAERDADGFAVRRVPRELQTSPEAPVEVHRDGDRDGFSGLHDRIVEHGDRTDNHHHWSGDWRRNHKYDWYSYRSRYGSLYRLGRYYDPYGWGYRRFSIGLSLWPSYYGSNFWLSDPWQYRLPPAYGPYRWVRYYDDALLMNIYTGQVVDVIHGFFW